MSDPLEMFSDVVLGLRPFCDFDWYAVDRAGHIAALCSFGMGAVPVESVAPGILLVDDYLDSQETRLRHEGRPIDPHGPWHLEYTALGFYVYGYAESLCGERRELYRREGIPTSKLLLGSLPLSIVSYLSAFRVDFLFDEVDVLNAHASFVNRLTLNV